ncbi:MAG: carboxypeptidase regulatory-like domain-containing protein, partial [Candidatus Riflebacteria bacterium]|nr:carboxypeptidase regulatory-like domain-containing protein [Candidatus Riflebacteria bacterium]
MLKKSVILVFCIFVLSLVIIGCGGGGGSSNPVGPTVLTGTTASLSGTVIYDEAPLANAAVYLYKSEKAYAIGVAQLPSFRGSLLTQELVSDGAYSTTTNAEGIYNFVNIPVGQYTLIAVKDENHQFAQTGVLLGAVTTLNPQLTPTGKISGKVTVTIGGTTQNIAGAIVYISGTSYVAITDASGNFLINNVPSNTLTTGASYEVQVSANQGTAAAKTSITVSPGATTNVGTFELAAPISNYKRITGTLVAGAGATSADLANIFVVLTRVDDGSLVGNYTNTNGSYTFTVTKTGNYAVVAVDTDYAFTPPTIGVNVPALDNTTMTLSSISITPRQIANTGSIIGTVSAAGSPLAGAVVHITGTSLLSVSNSTGNFVIEKVPANTVATPSYTVEVSSNMGTATAKTAVVNVSQATDIGNFAIAMPAAGYKTIVGTLTAVLPVTQPELTGKLVQLTAPDGKVSAAYSNAVGGFSFMATQTGAHSLTVMDNEFAYAPRTQSIAIAALDNAAQT